MSSPARSAYFRGYYLDHRDEILAKNRRWLAEHKERVAELRRARRTRRPPPEVFCLDCGARTARAPRCRACYQRFRYKTDPDYRARRLAINRRWQQRRAKR